MKAAIYPKKGTIEVAEIKKPALGQNEALIQVKYAGICGSDVNVLKGLHPTATYPRIGGHEFSGILVEANGTLREGLHIGDHVVAQPIWTCGTCEPCITGNDNVCSSLNIFGIHQDGCFAEYIRVPIHKVYKLPDSVSLKLGALAEPLAVAVHDVRESEIKVGEKALIIGGGPIGILIALVAQHAGAEVYVSEINPFRIQFIQSLGLLTIDSSKEDIRKRTKEITDGKGFDVVYEVSGSKVGIGLMTELVKIKGTIMLIGMSSEPSVIDTGAVFAKHLTLKGVRLHQQRNFEGAISILSEGSLNDRLEKMITKVFPLDQSVEAMRYQMEDAEHFKVVIKI